MQVIREAKEIQKKGPQSISKESLIESLKFLTENSQKTKESKSKADKSQRSLCQKPAHFQEIVFKKITKDKYGNPWGKIVLQDFLDIIWQDKHYLSHEFSYINKAARKLDIKQPYHNNEGNSYFKGEEFVKWCNKLYTALWEKPNKIFPELNFKKKGQYLEGSYNNRTVRIYQEHKGILHFNLGKKVEDMINATSTPSSSIIQISSKPTIRYSKRFLKNLGGVLNKEEHRKNQKMLKEDVDIKLNKISEEKRRYIPTENLRNNYGVNIPREHCRATIAAMELFFNKNKIDDNMKQPKITDYNRLFSANRNDYSMLSTQLRGARLFDDNGIQTEIKYPFCILTRFEIAKAYYPNIKNISKAHKDKALSDILKATKEQYYCTVGKFRYKTSIYYLDEVTSNDITNNTKLYQLSPAPLFFDGILESGNFQLVEQNIVGKMDNALKNVLNKKRIGHNLSNLSLTLLCFILINHNYALWIDGKYHRLSLQDMQKKGWFPSQLVKHRKWLKIFNMVDSVFKAIKLLGYIKQYRFQKSNYKGVGGIFHWVNNPGRLTESHQL